jgi:hypothetical protein
MHRPYQDLSNQELGDEFAAAVRMGGRPIIRTGTQLSYADLALEVVLDEFRSRAYADRAAGLSASAVHADDDDQDLPF